MLLISFRQGQSFAPSPPEKEHFGINTKVKLLSILSLEAMVVSDRRLVKVNDAAADSPRSSIVRVCGWFERGKGISRPPPRDAVNPLYRLLWPRANVPRQTESCNDDKRNFPGGKSQISTVSLGGKGGCHLHTLTRNDNFQGLCIEVESYVIQFPNLVCLWSLFCLL